MKTMKKNILLALLALQAIPCVNYAMDRHTLDRIFRERNISDDINKVAEFSKEEIQETLDNAIFLTGNHYPDGKRVQEMIQFLKDTLQYKQDEWTPIKGNKPYYKVHNYTPYSKSRDEAEKNYYQKVALQRSRAEELRKEEQAKKDRAEKLRKEEQEKKDRAEKLRKEEQERDRVEKLRKEAEEKDRVEKLRKEAQEKEDAETARLWAKYGEENAKAMAQIAEEKRKKELEKKIEFELKNPRAPVLPAQAMQKPAPAAQEEANYVAQNSVQRPAMAWPADINREEFAKNVRLYTEIGTKGLSYLSENFDKYGKVWEKVYVDYIDHPYFEGMFSQDEYHLCGENLKLARRLKNQDFKNISKEDRRFLEQSSGLSIDEHDGRTINGGRIQNIGPRSTISSNRTAEAQARRNALIGNDSYSQAEPPAPPAIQYDRNEFERPSKTVSFAQDIVAEAPRNVMPQNLKNVHEKETGIRDEPNYKEHNLIPYAQYDINTLNAQSIEENYVDDSASIQEIQKRIEESDYLYSKLNNLESKEVLKKTEWQNFVYDVRLSDLDTKKQREILQAGAEKFKDQGVTKKEIVGFLKKEKSNIIKKIDEKKNFSATYYATAQRFQQRLGEMGLNKETFCDVLSGLKFSDKKIESIRALLQGEIVKLQDMYGEVFEEGLRNSSELLNASQNLLEGLSCVIKHRDNLDILGHKIELSKVLNIKQERSVLNQIRKWTQNTGLFSTEPLGKHIKKASNNIASALKIKRFDIKEMLEKKIMEEVKEYGLDNHIFYKDPSLYNNAPRILEETWKAIMGENSISEKKFLEHKKALRNAMVELMSPYLQYEDLKNERKTINEITKAIKKITQVKKDDRSKSQNRNILKDNTTVENKKAIQGNITLTNILKNNTTSEVKKTNRSKSQNRNILKDDATTENKKSGEDNIRRRSSLNNKVMMGSE